VLSTSALTTALNVINTAGVVGVLSVAIWLGLRGDVVTAGELADCRAQRDAFLRGWIHAVEAVPTPVSSRSPIWRSDLDEIVRAIGATP